MRYATVQTGSRPRTACATALGIAALVASAGTTLAQDITRPGDTIVGFPVNWPGAESPDKTIDNTADTKYLNFSKLNTGFVVTPTGTGIVRGISIVTANDAPERDPADFILEGSNDNGATFVQIATGAFNPPTNRRAFAQALFANNTAYGQYRVTFPTVRTPGSANSMQVSEVRLITAGNILTPGDAFTVTYAPGASPGGAGGNENPTNLFDGRLTTKLGIDGGSLGPTLIDITPARGASIVTSLDIFGASDDSIFTDRTPTYVTLSGSNNGVTFTQIFTTPLQQLNINYSDQQFTFPNTTSYTTFRVELGPTPETATFGFLQVGELLLSGVAGPTPPANDTCATAQVIPAGATFGNNFNATGTDITACGSNDFTDVWYSYTAAASGLIEVNTIGAGILDTTLAVYDGCGGPSLGCNDNARGGSSRVRFNAVAGRTYKIRVAGVDGGFGTFALNVDTAPVVHSDVAIPLAYNFNGMVHIGEAGLPDAPNGFRSISDRALQLTGSVGSFEVGLEGPTGIPYTVVNQANVLDIVQLGDRNTVDNAFVAFDIVGPGNPDRNLTPPRNFIGVQPAWLPNSDNGTTPQVTDTSALALAMGPNTQIGVLFHASNGGTNFQMNLNFAGGQTASVTLNAPDWFGDQNPIGPFNGLLTQRQLGLFFGTGDVDNAQPDVDLNVVESTVSTSSLNDAGIGDFTGKQLTSISFADAVNLSAGTAIFAATIRDGIPATLPCLGDVTVDGVVDGNDFVAFINSFSLGNVATDAAADVNLDGTIDGSDYIAFINAFAAGC